MSIMDEAFVGEVAEAFARDIVRDIAPQEMPLFNSLARSGLEGCMKTRTSDSGRAEMLSFGMDVVVPIMTPIVLSAVMAVVKYVLGIIRESMKDAVGDVIKNALKALFKRLQSKDGQAGGERPINLTKDQLVEIRKLVLDIARGKDGLAESDATVLADAIVGRLAIAP